MFFLWYFDTNTANQALGKKSTIPHYIHIIVFVDMNLENDSDAPSCLSGCSFLPSRLNVYQRPAASPVGPHGVYSFWNTSYDQSMDCVELQRDLLREGG